MSNVEINIVKDSISARPTEEYAGPGNWECFRNGHGRSMFKSRAGAVRSVRAELAHYSDERFIAYVGQLGSGSWCAVYRAVKEES